MSTSSEDTEEREESMLELVLRAEAYLAANPMIASTSSSTSSSSGLSSSAVSTSSGSSRDASTSLEQDSFATAADSSLNSSIDLDRSTVSGTSSDLSTISSISRGSPAGGIVLTDDEGEFSGASMVDHSEDEVPRVQRTLSDDCILVPVVVPFIDLCTPRNQRDFIRRIANAAPILDSITLDDTVPIEPQAIPASIVQAQPLAVSLYTNSPPAKRLKEAPAPAPLDLSRRSDGAGDAGRSMDCPICYDSIFRKQAASTICGHLFCNACIKHEIKLRRQCPLCKRNLASKDIHPIYYN